MRKHCLQYILHNFSAYCMHKEASTLNFVIATLNAKLNANWLIKNTQNDSSLDLPQAITQFFKNCTPDQ